MKKTLAVLIVLLLFLQFSCSRSEEPEGIKSEVINGIKHVYNSSAPLKGIMTLQLEKIIQIDSNDVKPGRASFSSIQYDKDGNIYLGDSSNIKIYKFSKDGKLMLSFLRKGAGPGEFQSLPYFVILDSGIWVISSRERKIAWFDKKGQLLEERKLTKTGHGYTYVEIVDEDRFIGNYDHYEETGTGKEKRRIRVCQLLGKEETPLVLFYQAENVGYTEVKSEVISSAFVLPIVSPLIRHSYNHQNQTMYLSLSTKYEIFHKDLQAKTKLVIHREHQHKALMDADKDEIAALFKGSPPQVKQAIKKALPVSFCVIANFQFLPRGHLAVSRFTGVSSIEIDIFDSEGRFIYTVKSSDVVPDLRELRFFKKGVAQVEDIDDRDVYVAYRVTNLPGIFD
ncbi:MAG: 6-bladed beta-propeller [Candidatus Aminicenantes bacterium]|nr:MAG: 6-bladed beta-propeller [Candidatus Aminicenantes bacterium]